MEPLLDLELLRTFAAVVKAGELKKAAGTLFRSQAAVSMQLKRLEEQLGVRLLERNNQGIRLTRDGETLLGYTEQLLRLNNATLAALSQRQLAGKIRFGISTDYAQDFLMHFMPILLRELPHLEAHITCERSRSLRKLVARGELDVAIVAGEPGGEDEELLWSERLIWSAPATIRLEEQETLPVALYEDDCTVRDLCLADLKRAGIAYRRVFASPVMENIAAAVQAGMAVSLLPESLLKPGLTRPLPRQLLSSDAILRMNLIRSPLIATAILDKLAGCLREAGARLNGLA
ncbi:LysR family transcriptional regulator [Pseudomonas lalucatii]|uniref:LysR family transcriptional regulator n=1 Tax=Pseudomonas lalucatii TaxID=1424203 RepID=A0ABS5Q4N2_9PSED|nr:LysR family transcriptional regulator [Pseudomonas lalucatii]MBS7663731.1 LysR family transcriptional regulator [Pseudomonas lalucatii]MBS7725185.1 LysR family transcriptional regulator [Pseudomonas lalucatii]